MKIRCGFVSNSSSSSFAIYGTSLMYEEFVTMMKAKGIEIGNEDEEDDYPDYDAVDTALCQIEKGTKLEHYLDEECNIAIGRSFATLGDNETGAEFKNAACDSVAMVLGKNVPCNIMIETWSTG